jgi:hypothetical protein
MSRLPPQPPSREPPGARFRTQIEAAVAGGADPGDMRLRLTLRDLSLLQRDKTVPLHDIHYVDGAMRYLGVRVEQGGVPVSVLDVTPGSADGG